MKTKHILIIIFFLGVWYALKNYKTWYDEFQYSTQSPEGKTIDNKKQGTWKTYYRNGNLKQIENYRNDTLDGLFISYRPTGKIRFKTTYKMGIQVDSVIMYHSNGKINSAEWKDNNGRSQGTFKIYHKNGQPSQIAKNKDNHLDDTSRVFYEDGKLKKIEVYKNNLRNGKWIYYDQNGKLIKTETYVNDSLINKI